MSRYAKMMLLVGAAIAGVARCDEAVAGDDEWNAWLASGEAMNAEDELRTAGLKAGADEFDAIVRNTQHGRELQYTTSYSYSYSYSESPMPSSVPIPAPSAVPIPAPSANPIPAPSSVPIPTPSAVPIPAPSSVPIPAPSAVPIPAPSVAPTVAAVPSAAPSPDVVVPVTVGLNIGMSGISCAEYGDDEEDVMNQALAAHIAGATEDDFSDHTCSAARRLGEALAAAKAKATAQQRVRGRGRSLLSSDAISLYTEVTVDATEFGDDDIMGSVLSAVNTAVSSGALASSVTAYAAAAGLTSMDALTVTGVTVTTMTPTASPVTPSPTAKPVAVVVTPSPTAKPTEEEVLNGGGRVGASLTALALALGAIATLA